MKKTPKDKPKYKRDYYYEYVKVYDLLREKIPSQLRSKKIREITSKLVKE